MDEQGQKKWKVLPAVVGVVFCFMLGALGWEIAKTQVKHDSYSTSLEHILEKRSGIETVNIDSQKSTYIEKLVYDHDHNTLKVYWSNLDYYRAFSNVPETEWAGFKIATDKSKYYSTYISGEYESTRVFGLPQKATTKPETKVKPNTETKTTPKASTQKKLTEPAKAPHGYVKTYDENHNYTGLATWEELGLNHSNWDAEDFEHVSTPESTCFSEIGYDYIGKELKVIFRDSGAEYTYYGVPYNTWYELRDADSKGGYYNAEIKDNYNWRHGW